MTDRPRGKFGLPRLTDNGPMVSYHNNPASKCDKEVCFNGHSKERVFVSIRDSFTTHKPRLERKLDDLGVPVADIIISGSVVEGDFGCRDIGKIREEIDEVEEFWTKFSPEEKEAANKIKTIVDNRDSASAIWEGVSNQVYNNEELVTEGEVANMVEDVKLAICSDIDMFIVFPDNAKSRARTRWHSEEVQMKIDPIFADLNDDVVGRMRFIASESNESLQQEMDEPTISSKQGFDRILEKYYN